MKNTKITTSTREGWSIHIYDQDRHLRCTIEPSHGWAVGFGIVLGILITVLATNINLPIKVVTPPTQPSESDINLEKEKSPSVPTAAD